GPDLRHLQGAGRPALRADRLYARGSFHASLALPAPLDAWRQGIDLDRLGLSAEGLREMGRAGPPVGQALGRPLWQSRGRILVLGGLERAEHPLLAGHARGVPPAL